MFTPKFPWVRVCNMANVAINRNRNDIAKTCLDRKNIFIGFTLKYKYMFIHSFNKCR